MATATAVKTARDRAAEADWTPSLPARNEGFALTDLLVPVE
jgi:hypothetical protein